MHKHESDDIIGIIADNGSLQSDDFKRILYSGLTLRSHEYGYTYDQCRIISDWFVDTFKDDIFKSISKVGDNLIIVKDDNPIVKLEGLLRWHHTAIYLTEDLMTCAHLAYNNNLINPKFNWNPFLRTDSVALEGLLSRPLSDIHAHLKGSSLNFDVNWICLMNHVTNRQDAFRELNSPQQTFGQSQTLYEKAIIAAAIRFYLFGKAFRQNLITEQNVKTIIGASNLLASLSHASELQRMLDTSRAMYGRQFSDGMRTVKLDYASHEGINIDATEKCPYSALAGERFIMYSTLKQIHDNAPNNRFISSLLYLYLLIKNEIRDNLVQVNDAVGFENFNQYEHRKTTFVEGYPLYEKLLVNLSVSSFFADRAEGSTHETRIAPKDDYGKCLQSLKCTDKQISSSLFCRKVPLQDYGYDYHFIKKQDKTPKDLMPLYERHHALRDEVKLEALNIYRIRNGYEQVKDKFLADKIVGIDAANSEILCRPEVFAQAFRFLRSHHIEHPEIHSVKDLGITYHVGEDFIDVVDGLRAVDELLHFMNYRKGDRLGHALVLGVDVAEYYSKRHHSLCMTRQMLLDNVAWLYRMLNVYGGHKSLAKKLVKTYNEQFGYIYNGTGIKTPSIYTYYNSWLLRGDNPAMYQPDGSIISKHLGGWNECALNEDLDMVRRSKACCKLYYLYHYSETVKQNGSQLINIQDVIDDKLAESLIDSISFIQQVMLNRIRNMGIAIECNPTSNFKIGEIDRYDQHPIQIFYPYQKSRKEHTISSSINTDDKGIFATSIEREYALIYAAFWRKQKHNHMLAKKSRNIDQWIDEIRKCSNEQSFVRNNKTSNIN